MTRYFTICVDGGYFTGLLVLAIIRVKLLGKMLNDLYRTPVIMTAITEITKDQYDDSRLPKATDIALTRTSAAPSDLQ